MFSIASCAGLFALEAIYILGFYDPNATKTHAGLMLIFALEASFLVKISQSNLEENKALGKISGTTRLYSAIAMLPLLGLFAVAEGLFSLNQYSLAWIALFLVTAVGKVIWLKRMRQIAVPGAMDGTNSN